MISKHHYSIIKAVLQIQNGRVVQRSVRPLLGVGANDDRLSKARTFHSTSSLADDVAEKVSITFVEPDGTERIVEGTVGKHLLDVAHENNIELEGACGGELACSTCHLIFEKHIYDQLEPKKDDEEDMLDMALALTDTSRLGCQIELKKEYEGMKLQIPDDGFN